MNYKTLALIAISILVSFLNPALAVQPEFPQQNGNPLACNFGFKGDYATDSIALDDVTLVDLNDYLPADGGNLGFEIRAVGGDFVINHPDKIATGTDLLRRGRLVPDGESYIWNANAGDFVGVIVANSATATVVIDGVWGQYELPDE